MEQQTAGPGGGSQSEFHAQFHQQRVFPGAHMIVTRHDLFDRREGLLLVGAGGEGPSQQQRLFLGLVAGLHRRSHPGHGRVKCPLAIRGFDAAHGRQQFLQLPVRKRGQMAVRIHGQNQQIEKRRLLGG